MNGKCGSSGNETDFRHLENSSGIKRLAQKGEIIPALGTARHQWLGVQSCWLVRKGNIYVPVMCRWDASGTGVGVSLKNPQKFPQDKESVFECLPWLGTLKNQERTRCSTRHRGHFDISYLSHSSSSFSTMRGNRYRIVHKERINKPGGMSKENEKENPK